MRIDDEFHFIVADHHRYSAAFIQQEDQSVESHLELRTGADEGAAYWLLLAILPRKLQSDEPGRFFVGLQRNVVETYLDATYE